MLGGKHSTCTIFFGRVLWLVACVARMIHQAKMQLETFDKQFRKVTLKDGHVHM